MPPTTLCGLGRWEDSSWGEGHRDPGALWGLSLFLHFRWLPLQGPPGMRGSPGPPGPIVSICGFLAHLRSSRRGHNAQTPFCCLVPRKLGRAEGGKFYRPPLALIRASVGTVGSHHPSPWNWSAPSRCAYAPASGRPSGTPLSPTPHPYNVLDSGPRLPWREGLSFWLMVSAARKVCGNPTRSLHASMPPVATGVRG